MRKSREEYEAIDIRMNEMEYTAQNNGFSSCDRSIHWKVMQCPGTREYNNKCGLLFLSFQHGLAEFPLSLGGDKKSLRVPSASSKTAFRNGVIRLVHTRHFSRKETKFQNRSLNAMSRIREGSERY